MDFFAQQDVARKKTGRLVFLFILAVVFIIVAVYGVALVLLQFVGPPGNVSPEDVPRQFVMWRPDVFLTVAALVALAVGTSSLLKLAALRKGGSYVAESLGGRPVSSDTTDRDERRLLNVVEEVAIASGVPVPAVFVLPGEPGINAFAAGWSTSDAAVAVTEGAMHQLNRDELQGVVAHEFSHVLNGDMRLNIKLIALISGIMVLATIGYWALHIRPSRGSKNGGGGYAAILLAALALLIIGYGGAFVGRIIQSAVSRQREYLADASAVQFTRNPAGIANALKKIGGFQSGSVVRAPASREVRHMFFGASDVGSFMSSVFATHPPLQDRIKRLDPSFEGDWSSMTPSTAAGAAGASGFAGAAGRPASSGATGAAAIAGIGTLTIEQVEAGASLIAAIPADIRSEISEPLGACAVVCAMLLDGDEAVRQRQLVAIEKTFSEVLSAEVTRVAGAVSKLERHLLLPIGDLALPAMRRMSPVQYIAYSKTISALVRADNQVTLFEFCLQKVVEHRLFEAFQKPSAGVSGVSGRQFVDDAVVLLSAVAAAGGGTEEEAKAAMAAGLKTLFNGRTPDAGLPQGQPSLERLNTAFDNFASAPMKMRRMILLAVSDCIVHDRHVTLAESEMLRAVAYCLSLPLPPYIPSVAA